MVNDGLAVHEHPAHCQEFWTSVMEVAQIQLDDDLRHATIHSFLDDVPRFFPCSRLFLQIICALSIPQSNPV